MVTWVMWVLKLQHLHHSKINMKNNKLHEDRDEFQPFYSYKGIFTEASNMDIISQSVTKTDNTTLCSIS